MTGIIILILIGFIVYLIIKRSQTKRQRTISNLKKELKRNPKLKQYAMPKAIVLANEIIPYIDKSVFFISNNNIASYPQGIVFMEMSCIYVIYAYKFMISNFNDEHETLLSVFSGGIIDYAQYDLNWPESSLQEFQLRISKRLIEYIDIIKNQDIKDLINVFYTHINNCKPITNNRYDLIKKEFIKIQANISKVFSEL